MDNKNQEETITCPKCHELIPIKATLHKQLSESLKEDIESKLKGDYESKLLEDKKKLEREAVEKAQAAVMLELRDLREQKEENTKKIEAYQEQELSLRKKTRELGGARALMRSHHLCFFQRPVIKEVRRNTRGAEGTIT